MSFHEEEVLGKAYDANLMRRLLWYLRPYKPQVALALVAIICASVLQLAQPYLMKLAIDRYIANGDLAGINRIAVAFLAILVASFILEYAQMWTLQHRGADDGDQRQRHLRLVWPQIPQQPAHQVCVVRLAEDFFFVEGQLSLSR